MIELHLQETFDKAAFDPEDGYRRLSGRDQKIRHIQLHVAKAAMKIVSGSSEQIVTEVIPDAAIYRSQLINIIGLENIDGFARNFPDDPVETQGTAGDISTPEDFIDEGLDSLIEASGSLAKYLERLEHGADADPDDVLFAAICLHSAAHELAACFDVDVDEAHIGRLRQYAPALDLTQKAQLLN